MQSKSHFLAHFIPGILLGSIVGLAFGSLLVASQIPRSAPINGGVVMVTDKLEYAPGDAVIALLRNASLESVGYSQNECDGVDFIARLESRSRRLPRKYDWRPSELAVLQPCHIGPLVGECRELPPLRQIQQGILKADILVPDLEYRFSFESGNGGNAESCAPTPTNVYSNTFSVAPREFDRVEGTVEMVLAPGSERSDGSAFGQITVKTTDGHVYSLLNTEPGTLHQSGQDFSIVSSYLAYTRVIHTGSSYTFSGYILPGSPRGPAGWTASDDSFFIMDVDQLTE